MDIGKDGGGVTAKGREADGKGPECQLPERNLQELKRARWVLREWLTGPRGGRGPRGATMSGGPLPDDVHQGSEEGLHLVAEAVLGAQGLDQRGHPAIVVPRHRGEETGENSALVSPDPCTTSPRPSGKSRTGVLASPGVDGTWGLRPHSHPHGAPHPAPGSALTDARSGS